MSAATGAGWSLPHGSRRQPVLGDDVVATSQPLAVQAGMAMFEAGGNAVDAALAAAITLTVVEPTSNGIGGDAFAIVADDGELHGLNGSGRAPAAIDVDRLLSLDAMPLVGWDAVTVPGAVSAWQALHERFGRLDFAALCAPAIRHADEGFPVSPLTAREWAGAARAYPGRADFSAAFLPGGRAPRAGERFALPEQAETLAEIAATSGASFYRGELAERIVAHAAVQGAALTGEDLAAHEATWVGPLAVDHGEHTVHELPPNGQGLAALIALAVLDRLDGRELPPGSAAAIHLEAEAMKAAFAEVSRHVADPDAMTLRAADLLAPERIERLAAGVYPDRVGDPGPGTSDAGGTVYLVTGDRDGMMVSFIQSNYVGFGSGVVVPGTGIALHNRGGGFVTEPGHPNVVAPRRRPFHTIIPGFLSVDGEPLMAFGVMGGPMQPQGHLQVVRRVVDGGENPQAALDAPRWRVAGGAGTGPGGGAYAGWTLHVEEGLAATGLGATDLAATGGGDATGEGVLDALVARGHDVSVEPRWDPSFGGGQVALRLRSGGYVVGSDPRKDGHAAAR